MKFDSVGNSFRIASTHQVIKVSAVMADSASGFHLSGRDRIESLVEPGWAVGSNDRIPKTLRRLVVRSRYRSL